MGPRPCCHSHTSPPSLPCHSASLLYCFLTTDWCQLMSHLSLYSLIQLTAFFPLCFLLSFCSSALFTLPELTVGPSAIPFYTQALGFVLSDRSQLSSCTPSSIPHIYHPIIDHVHYIVYFNIIRFYQFSRLNENYGN